MNLPPPPPRRNPLLLFVSAVFLGISVAAAALLLSSAVVQLQDLEKVSLASVATPCGTAVPDLSRLLYGIGARTFEPLDLAKSMRTSSANLVKETHRALCDHSDILDVISALFASIKNVNISHDTSTISNTVCDKGDSDVMDVGSRIARAYIRAHPAFVNYHTFSSGSGNDLAQCEWSHLYDNCGAEAFMRAEMAAAAVDQGAVEGSYGGLPDLHVMLYRLVVLSTISQQDIQRNSNRCFKNTLKYNASELCTSIYASVDVEQEPGSGPPPSPPTMPYDSGTSNLQYSSFYYSAGAHTTCADVSASKTSLSAPPPPPAASASSLPARVNHFVYETNNGTNGWSSKFRGCVRSHELGMYETEQLFGLPNHDENVAQMTSRLGSDFYESSFLEPYFLNNRLNRVLTSPQRELMLFSAARVAISMFYLVPAMCAVGFWTVFGGLPLAAQAIALLRSIRSGKFPPINRPPASIVQVLASVTSLTVAAYVLFVDPVATPVYNRRSCESYASSGDVFETSETLVKLPVTIAGGLILTLALLSGLYSLFLRRGAASIQVVYVYTITNRSATLLGVLAVGILMIFDGLLLKETLDKYIQEVVHYDDEGSRVRIARLAYNDGVVALSGAFLGSCAVSALSDAWILKSPQRSSLTRILWMIGVITLSGINILIDYDLNTVANKNSEGLRLMVWWARIIVVAAIGGTTILNWRDMDQSVGSQNRKSVDQTRTRSRAARSAKRMFRNPWSRPRDNMQYCGIGHWDVTSVESKLLSPIGECEDCNEFDAGGACGAGGAGGAGNVGAGGSVGSVGVHVVSDWPPLMMGKNQGMGAASRR